jgi:hypothetical protein
MEPNGATVENGLVLWFGFDGLFADEDEAHMWNGVCETEIWPVW